MMRQNILEQVAEQIKSMKAAGELKGDVDALVQFVNNLETKTFGQLKRKYRFQIYKGNDKQFYGRLIAPNGKIMDATEGMRNKKGIFNNYERKKIAYLCSELEDNA